MITKATTGATLALCAVLTGAFIAAADSFGAADGAPNCSEEAQCYRDYVKYFMKNAHIFEMSSLAKDKVPGPVLNAYNDAMTVAKLEEWATKPEQNQRGVEAIRAVCSMKPEDVEKYNYLKGRLNLSDYGKTEFELAVRGMGAINRVFGVMGEKEKPCDYLEHRLSSARPSVVPK